MSNKNQQHNNKICMKSGLRIIDPIVCAMCRRHCPLAGKPRNPYRTRRNKRQ